MYDNIAVLSKAEL